ncbi:MAG: hypothetical protein HYV28_04145 [Ignavibacteriales bacterium]|nr:hypothetical protein [Ignavibacteriales bacterium]
MPKNSNDYKTTQTLKTISCIILGCIFFVSAISKGLSYTVFISEVNDLAPKLIPMPQIVIAVCGIAFLILEALLGIAFLFRKINLPILMTALIVAVFFLFINTYRVIQNPAQECNCFGEFIHMEVIYSLLLDVVMLLIISRLLSATYNSGIIESNKAEAE